MSSERYNKFIGKDNENILVAFGLFEGTKPAPLDFSANVLLKDFSVQKQSKNPFHLREGGAKICSQVYVRCFLGS
ncbi:hypothetical protein CDL15_Pgr010232 [Punica granatum]|uniref:Uncharacterized protein n=1 Tax=Punica granatum TaxID=22663 RepID=A0A218XQT6_PUNGR|nr:hypothetical protein CDL15_Pgr010232 [Punica granatum]